MDVNEGEDPDRVLLQVYHKAHRINAVLQRQIELVRGVERVRADLVREMDRLDGYNTEFKRLEKDLIDFADTVTSTGDELKDLERKRTVLCARERVEDLRTDITAQEKQVDEAKKRLTESVLLLSKLRKLGKEGNFNEFRLSDYPVPKDRRSISHEEIPYDWEADIDYWDGSEDDFHNDYES